MYGHGVPILPHQNPNAVHAKPTLHLEAEPHNDEAVRAQIIAEEEAKAENQDEEQVDENPGQSKCYKPIFKK